MDPLRIVVEADLSGANQLAGGVEAAMGRVVAAQLRVKSETLALKEAYAELGPAAQRGSTEAIAAIAEHEAALVSAARELKSARIASQAAATATTAPAVTSSGTDQAAAIAEGNENIDSSAQKASESLGRLAAQEALERSSLGQSVGLQQIAIADSRQRTVALQQEAASAGVIASANQRAAASAMEDAEAWEMAYTAQDEAALSAAENAAAQDSLFGATSRTGVAAEHAAAAEAEEATVARTSAAAHNLQAGGARMAAEGISILEGRMRAGSYAAANFLTHTLGLGKAIEAIFPAIGLASIAVVFYEIGKAAYNAFQNVVLLKGEIDALGDASAKTAREAAAANWQYIESYVELLKAQGKFAEAQRFEQANATAKPEHLTLGLSKEQIKELPKDMQEFARSLEYVNTVGQAKEKGGVFENLGTQITKAQAHVKQLQKEIDEWKPAPHPYLNIDPLAIVASVASDALRKSRLEHQLTAAKEYYAALTNIRNSNSSSEAAQINKDASSAIALSKDAANRLVAVAKQREEGRLAAISAELGAQAALYASDKISAQEWVEVQARADHEAAEAHRQYAEQAISAFRRAGDAQKASQVQAEYQKEVGDDLKTTAEELVRANDALDKTLEEYQGQVIKSAQETKSDSQTLKDRSEAALAVAEANRTLINSERELTTEQQKSGYSAVTAAINERASTMINSERYVRAAMSELYEQEFLDEKEKLEKQLATEQSIMERIRADMDRIREDLAGGGLDADATAAATTRLSQLKAELEQQQAAYNETDAQILAAQTKLDDQLAQLTIQAMKKQEAAVHEFVQQSTTAMNGFLTTIITQTGVVNGRISEWRFLEEQWSKMLLRMEQDFLNFIFKSIENTALFQRIQNGLSSALNSVLSAVHLGPANVTSGINLNNAPNVLSPTTLATISGATPAAAATSAGTTSAVAQQANTAALTTSTAALQTFTASLTAATPQQVAHTTATQVGTATQIAHTSTTQASTVATTVHAGATQGATVATVANAGTTTGNTAATAVDTAATGAHTTTIFSSIGAWVAHEASVIGDTAALIAHKIAALFTGAASGGLVVRAQTGGLIYGPGTDTSDDIPMRVSAGEFIVRGAAVKSPGTLNLLHAINSGRLTGDHVQNIAGREGIRGGEGTVGGLRPAEARNDFESGGREAAPGGSFALHWHEGNHSALDAAGVDAVLKKSRGTMTALVRDAVNRGHINPRNFVK